MADRVGEARIVPYALVLTGSGLWLLIFLDGTGLLVLSGLVTGTGQGFLYPTLNALAVRGEPVDIRGKINGAYTGGIDAGIFAGSAILGFIGEAAGFPAIFLAAGAALFLGLGIYTLERRRGGFRKI
ncbi:MAG: MFS transporter [Thermodesulfobacteriota bacterium]